MAAMAAPQEAPIVVTELADATVGFGGRWVPHDPVQDPPGLREFTLRVFGEGVPVLFGRQRHTSISFSFSPSSGGLGRSVTCVGTCDALITATPGVALAVQTADCLPIALAGRGVVAMIHAGWRGLAADILGRLVHRLEVEWGVEAADLASVIGVGIGPCHYPVGNDVHQALSLIPMVGAPWARGAAVDLAGWAYGRLLALGLVPARVSVLSGCTWCSPDHHSFRRDGERAGRQWSGIVLRSAADGGSQLNPRLRSHPTAS